MLKGRTTGRYLVSVIIYYTYSFFSVKQHNNQVERFIDSLSLYARSPSCRIPCSVRYLVGVKIPGKSRVQPLKQLKLAKGIHILLAVKRESGFTVG